MNGLGREPTLATLSKMGLRWAIVDGTVRLLVGGHPKEAETQGDV